MNAPVQNLTSVDQIRQKIKELSVEDLVGSVKPPGFPDRFGNYQYTSHGRIFFSCDPRADEIHIDDIARHLSRICRFGGGNKRWMSVAEHCWHCSQIVPPHMALEALLHDAAEAYIGDQIRPMKYLPIFGDIYLKVEAGIEKCVAERFKLQYPWPTEVRWADEAVVGVEVERNIASSVINHLSDAVETPSEKIMLYHWDVELAELMFMARFNELTRDRGSA